jgi:hypothetical protein
MMRHNFLISTTRPDLLAKQIVAFSNVGKNRELNFFVFDDTPAQSNRFLEEIERAKKLAPKRNIYYFSLVKQIEIIKRAAIAYSDLIHVDEQSILDCFNENNAPRGIRSIQNKSVCIFYLMGDAKGSIVHKIDDDVFPYEAERRGESVETKLKRDFFEQKELSIGGSDKIISGNNYTFDSPSPLANYTDFVEFVFNFYSTAGSKPEERPIGNDMLKISPTKVRRVIDHLNILDVLPIDKDYTYKEAHEALKLYASMMENGNSRIIINDDKENFDGINNFFPGGCVSFLYENLPTLTPTFGNQDLLWEMFEILDGKTLVTNGYIGHLKSSGDRPSIVNDLMDSSYKHQTSLTYSTFKYLSEKSGGQTNIINFQKNFIDSMDKWLKESRWYSTELIKLIDETDLSTNRFKQKSAKAIRKICSTFLASYDKIEANYSCMTGNIEPYLENYYKQKDAFDKFMDSIFWSNKNRHDVDPVY